jgi:hypothetical protein
MKPHLKPSVRAGVALAREYYKTNPTGGSLHIVLDDGNVKDKNVEFCWLYAIKEGDKEGEQLAQLLMHMSETQRMKVYRSK